MVGGQKEPTLINIFVFNLYMKIINTKIQWRRVIMAWGA